MNRSVLAAKRLLKAFLEEAALGSTIQGRIGSEYVNLGKDGSSGRRGNG